MLFPRRHILLASLAALVGKPIAAGAAEPIQFATIAGLDFMLPLLANDLGLFKKRGLTVETQIAPQPPALLPAVVGGSIQYGVSTGIQVSIVNEAGLDVVIVAGAGVMTRDDVNTAVVMRPDTDLKTPESFIGKKIVVPGVNGSYHMLFVRYLKLGGVDPKQVTFLEGGFAQMPDMLRAKQVDAVLAAEPFLTRMLESGVGKRLNYFTPDRDFTFMSFFIAKRSWVEAHKAELEDIRAALREAVALSKTDTAATNASIAKNLKLPPEVLARQKPASWRVDVTPDDVQFWADLALQSGLLKAPVDARKLLV